MNGSIRIPILEQDYRPSFTPQNYVDAVQVSDPRGAALQGLGKSIGEVGEAIRENQKKETKAAEADHPAIAQQTGENNKAWTVDAFAQCTQEAAGLTQKVTGIGGPANASTDAALGSAAAGEPLSKFYLDPMAIAKLPSPVQTAVAGLMPGSGAGAAPGAGAANGPRFMGGAGAGDPSSPDPASLTDPAIHGTTGAWINGYDLIADKAIAAAPTPQTADDLIQQCTTARQSGISRVLRFEADANLAKRQETVLRAAQNVGASRLRQDPAALPGVLAFFEAHKLDVGADNQKAFDAQWRGALVDAAVQGQMERDPKGLLLTLENRRSRQESGADNGTGTTASNDDAIDPLGAHLAEHPLASALTPEEVARYLPQVRAGVYTAASNQRASLLQQTKAATQSYLSTGKAASAPSEADFISSFGLEDGRQRFQAQEQARSEGEQYINMRALPTPVLLEMQGNAQRGLRATAQANPDTLGSPAPAGADTATPFGLRLPGADPADPAYAARSGESGITQSVVSRILADRRDPIQAGQEAGAYGITPADLSSPQAALQSAATRVPIAGMVAGDYGTEPVLYSQAEFAQLAKTLQALPGPARAAWFAQFTRSIGDAALVQSTLRGLSVHSRAIALAGQLQFEESQGPGNGSADAWGGDGKLNAAQLIFTGDALIKAGGVAMPPESETRSAFRAAFGDTYADAPGEEEMRYEGALAAYAALGQQAGDASGKFDAGRWQAAMNLASFGSGTAREVGLDGASSSPTVTSWASHEAPQTNSAESRNGIELPVGDVGNGVPPDGIDTSRQDSEDEVDKQDDAAIERRIWSDLLADQENEDSIRGGQFLQTGGSMRNAARSELVMVKNGNWDATLNVVADPVGLLGEMPGIMEALGQLGNARAKNLVDETRKRMVNAGVKKVPGYSYFLDANGNSRIDYQESMRQLQNSYESSVRDQRLRQMWGDDYENIRIGKSKYRAQEFEQKILDIHQNMVDASLDKGIAGIKSGKIKIKNNNFAATLGSYIDDRVRFGLRSFANIEGISDNTMSSIWAINRRISSEEAGYGIPDSRLGANLLADTSIAWKTGETPQIQQWKAIVPDAKFLIIRPTRWGGAYVIPPSSIQLPATSPKGTGKIK